MLADAAYGTAPFMNKAASTFDGAQVITQLRKNQIVVFHGRKRKLDECFRREGVPKTLTIRGRKVEMVIIDSARLHVECHGKKRFIIALKYDGESEYRYLVASDMSWRTCDIVSIWTLRWLVEVFFDDWKGYEGWDKLAKQQREDGSRRGLILSFVVDHCLFLHPSQLAQVKNKQPAFTVGSLMNQIKADAVITLIQDLVLSDAPVENLAKLATVLREQFTLQMSTKHMVACDLGRQGPTPALRYRAELAPLSSASRQVRAA